MCIRDRGLRAEPGGDPQGGRSDPGRACDPDGRRAIRDQSDREASRHAALHPDQLPQRRRRAPQSGRNRQRQGRRTGLDDLGRRTLRLDAASKFAALDHGFASRRIGSVSAAPPGQVDARLHVDGQGVRGWTRYQSIRFTDRTLTAVVQSACNKPVSTLITHDHVRSAHGAWMAGPCRIPKLTVRVRFPSPAPHAKNVAIHTNWAPFSFWNGARRHQKSALVPLPRAISHAGGTVSWNGASGYGVPRVGEVSSPHWRADGATIPERSAQMLRGLVEGALVVDAVELLGVCLLYTSDAADDLTRVDLG